MEWKRNPEISMSQHDKTKIKPTKKKDNYENDRELEVHNAMSFMGRGMEFK